MGKEESKQVHWVSEYLYEDVMLVEDGVSVLFGALMFEQPTSKIEVIKIVLIHGIIMKHSISDKFVEYIKDVLPEDFKDNSDLRLMFKTLFPNDDIETYLTGYFNGNIIPDSDGGITEMLHGLDVDLNETDELKLVTSICDAMEAKFGDLPSMYPRNDGTDCDQPWLG